MATLKDDCECFGSFFILSIILLYVFRLGIMDYWKPLDGFLAAKCSFLSVQDHGSTDCRYCKE